MNDQFTYGFDSFRSNFDHRFDLNYEDGLLVGTNINTVDAMEKDNADASDACLTAWAFNFYQATAVIGQTDPSLKYELLNKGLEAYLQTPNKSLMKFWVTVIIDSNFGLSYPSNDPWKYLVPYSEYIAALMRDPDYHRIEGLCPIGLFTGGAGPKLTDQIWDQFLAPMGGRGNVFAIQMSGNPIDAQRFCRAMFRYGPQNLGSGLGHIYYQDLVNIDDRTAQNPPAGLRYISQITPCVDPRPLDKTNTSRTYTDQPTQAEFLLHCMSQFGTSGSVQTITIWGERQEEGSGVGGTRGEGRRYLRAFKRARTGVQVPNDVSEINLATRRAATSGWTYAGPFPGFDGAHERDLMLSSAAGDSISLAIDSKIIWSPTALFELMAPNDPSYGSVEVLKNGVTVGTVSLGGPPAQHLSVLSVDVALGDTLVVRNAAGISAVDSWRVTQ